MFQHTFYVLCIFASAILIFVPALIIGSVGAHRLAITRQQLLVYTNTTCFVTNMTIEILSWDCDCDECNPPTCYDEYFVVQYQIENGTVISGEILLDDILRRSQFQVNNSYTCYYDRTIVTNVQWFKPTERPALAMLIFGFGIAGMVVLAILLIPIWWLMQPIFCPSNSHNRL